MLSDSALGYGIDQLIDGFFSQMSHCTPAAIRSRLSSVPHAIKEAVNTGRPVFISMGENCGPAYRLSRAEAPGLGGGYFDSIVTPPASLSRIVRARFSGILELKNLSIGEWEGHDSIMDEAYDIFYHHSFYMLNRELVVEGRRTIHEEHIPTFYGIVHSQFQYLSEKMLMALADGELRKVLVYRTRDGLPLDWPHMVGINDALESVGACNFKLVAIYSHGEPDEAARPSHRLIPEPNVDVDRWGRTEDWKAFVDAEMALHDADPARPFPRSTPSRRTEHAASQQAGLAAI